MIPYSFHRFCKQGVEVPMWFVNFCWQLQWHCSCWPFIQAEPNGVFCEGGSDACVWPRWWPIVGFCFLVCFPSLCSRRITASWSNNLSKNYHSITHLHESSRGICDIRLSRTRKNQLKNNKFPIWMLKYQKHRCSLYRKQGLSSWYCLLPYFWHWGRSYSAASAKHNLFLLVSWLLQVCQVLHLRIMFLPTWKLNSSPTQLLGWVNFGWVKRGIFKSPVSLMMSREATDCERNLISCLCIVKTQKIFGP